MVRLNLKTALLALCAGACASVLLYVRCGDRLLAARPPDAAAASSPNQDLQQGYEEIDCHINGEYNVPCRKEGGEVYVPFSFLHKYFEVYGKLAVLDGLERFEWAHSYSKVYPTKGRYDPKGVFMYFDNYNVEVRERVKCVSGAEGVPVSTQWESQGYFYPTQVAQFALSHWSKNLTDPEPRHLLLEDGDKVQGSWNIAIGSLSTRSHGVVSFEGPDGISLALDHVLDLVLSLDIRLQPNSSFTVSLQSRDRREPFHLHYLCSDLALSAQGKHIYHGLGKCTDQWRRLTRDLLVDLQKGLAYVSRGTIGTRKKVARSKLKVVGITFRGGGHLDNLTFSSSEHLAQFYDGARWLVRHQDTSTGGWPNPVRRRVAPGMADLPPGWFSAMGQGHGLSVLARAYHQSGDKQYLDAAESALGPFRVPSEKGGVLAKFMGVYTWYEEYPTRPASFVLNGFIYSLLGLYDLAAVAPGGPGRDAALRLYRDGLLSLKALLPLFDTGSGTSYDLRHVTLGLVAAPNLARWDYHATHVNQLLVLASIEDDPGLLAVAQRWASYMQGKRAPHN